MEELEDLSYRAEYAKSSRASCKKCKGNIEKDTLRLAAMVQSPHFDGKVPHWYHFMCFFGKLKPKSEHEIAHLDSLRWEDQQKIKDKIGGSSKAPSGKSNKKQKKNTDFNMEYAKSSRASCKGCAETILKGEVRISRKEYESDTAKRFGGIDRWHHVDCFIKKRDELEFYEGGETLPGFNTLSADDKKVIREKIVKITPKRKAEDEANVTSKKPKVDENAMQKQSKKMFYFRDWLQKNLRKAELISLLRYNEYIHYPGESKNLDILADLMTFGVMKLCKICKAGAFVYKYCAGYVCTGNMSEWTKCTNVVETPERVPFKVPSELKESFDFLNGYKYKDYGPRIIIKRDIPTKKPSSSNGTTAPSKPLDDMEFVILGKTFSQTKMAMKAKIKSLGGKVVNKIGVHTAAIITSADHMNSKAGKDSMASAESLEVHCVTDDFLNEVEAGGAPLMIQKKSISSWGSDVEKRIKMNPALKKKVAKSTADSRYSRNIPDKLKVKLKDGAAVDPDSELEDCSHVYKEGKRFYNSVLGVVDIVRGTNSYYKLQLLESDNKRRWWVFRSWGRIGTTIGNNKLEEMEDLEDAKAQFNTVFEEKTGNLFKTAEFKKISGFWYPLEIDYGQDEVDSKIQVEKSTSKLPVAIKKFISMIFDVESMKSAMIEFEIDLKKMPLGKLSKRQIEKAYRVLSEALILTKSLETKKESKDEEELKAEAIETKAKLLDCSNRFYTLIPHDFGMQKPPLLNNEEFLKSKITMLDNLCEIEVAYNLLKTEDESTKDLDPIDKHYKKLKTEMQVLERTSEEFQMVKKYIKNTHAATHSHYTLKLDEVFKIERVGEKKRFKPFKKLQNHQLLWHGSRLTNYAGILSQGLRIAPPEAPVTGYMFGKGVYFADMVSKSANYCCTSSSNNTGVLLLSDVALGNMYERTHADYINQLPKGKHSTKGLGITHPNPDETINIEDGIQVPLGKPVKTDTKDTSLLYNEYIVYDVAQINAKYLLQVKFNFK